MYLQAGTVFDHFPIKQVINQVGGWRGRRMRLV
jgi:hypothetical protein